MGRPAAVRHTSPKTVRDVLYDVQAKRFDLLKSFRAQIAAESVSGKVKDDDGLFAEIVRLSVEEYGVTQAAIAERTRISPAAVGRWAKQINLPHALSRAPVVGEIVAILDEFIEQEQRRGKAAKGELVLLSGRVRH